MTKPGYFFDEDFFRQFPLARDVTSLFDFIPHIIFYAKNQESRFVAANSAMAEAKTLTHPEEILGRCDHDFHPPTLADAYVAEDRRVMEDGSPLPHQIWFVMDQQGHPGWFNSSKVPLHDKSGAVVGVAGVRYSIETPQDLDRQFRSLAPVIHHLEEHYTESISMKEMAGLAGLSSTHFNRHFQDLLGTTPTRFLHSLRLEKARQLLASSDRNVGEIALETGFHDQSHFTRHFRKQMGMTPRAYRIRFRSR